VQDDGLVRAQHGPACNTWSQCISDLTCGTAKQTPLVTRRSSIQRDCLAEGVVASSGTWYKEIVMNTVK
jgi:hypothetical protein